MSGGAWVELFDATAHALDEAPDLVLLELAGASFAPVEQVPMAATEDEFQPGVFSEPSREQIIAGLRTVLADAAPPPELPLAGSVGHRQRHRCPASRRAARTPRRRHWPRSPPGSGMCWC